jgi:hypothetical protein
VTLTNRNTTKEIRNNIIRTLRNSAVGKATDYRLDGQVQFPGGRRKFSFLHLSRPVLGPIQPPFQQVAEAVYPEVKLSEREGDYSLSSSAEVKNGGTIQPLPHTYLRRGA